MAAQTKKQQLKEIGVEVEIEGMDGSAFFPHLFAAWITGETVEDTSWDLASNGMDQMNADPATKMTGYKGDENLYNEYTCGRGIFLSSEIAQIAVFSISDYFDCISGEVLSCNQGNHLRSNYD